jgi:hypothetical protein
MRKPSSPSLAAAPQASADERQSRLMVAVIILEMFIGGDVLALKKR